MVRLLSFDSNKAFDSFDTLFVNSKFTAGVFRDTFKTLSSRNVDVLYPTLHAGAFDFPEEDAAETKVHLEPNTCTFLSINRYERKKNIGLAIEAFQALYDSVDAATRQRLRLIVAGGYDDRVAENVEHYKELQVVAKPALLESGTVQFLKSPDDTTKRHLMRNAAAVVYTPMNEHFGIVPVEAMYLATPVIACNSGGPLESILNEKTGYLCEANANAFASAMRLIYEQWSDGDRTMGRNGRQHVCDMFGFKAFALHLHKSALHTVDGHK